MSPVVIKPGEKSGAQAGNRPLAVETGEREDRFHLGWAFRAWVQLVGAPRVFYEAEEDATGFKAPFAVLCAYMLLYYCAWCLVALVGAVSQGYGDEYLVVLLGILPTLLFTLAYITILALWSTVLHGVSRLCGGSGDYSGTFRAVVYAFAPYAFLTLLQVLFLLLTEPTGSHRYSESNPILLTLSLISLVWTVMLMILGLRVMQRLTPIGAVGAVLVSGLLLVVLWWAMVVAGMGIFVLKYS